MAVEKIEECNLPSEKGSKNPIPEKPKDEDFAKEMKEYRQEIVKTGIAKEIMGTGSPDNQMRQIEQAIEKRMEPIQKMVSKITEDKEKSDLYSGIVGAVKQMADEVKNAVKEGKATQQDPMKIYHEVGEIFSGFADKLKGKLGVGDTSAQNIPGLIELEEKRIDRDERQRQHDREITEERHRWEVEEKRLERQERRDNIKWQHEFALEIKKFDHQAQTQERAAGALEDLAGSAVAAIDAERGVAEKETKVETKAEKKPKPKKFRCTECQGIVTVASPDATEAECPKCGTLYDMAATE